jgi:L-amino acid N-acyltransferase YncA
MEGLLIEKMSVDSWNEVLRIYKSGIAGKNASFETQAPGWESWDKTHRQDCRIIAKIEKKIVGWAALSNVSSRCVYNGIAEVSIYVDPDYQRQGVGNRLMEALIKESESNNIWTLQAGIFPENKGSMKLHQKHGFRIIGIRERIGKMNNRWRDVALLERRSKVAGID